MRGHYQRVGTGWGRRRSLIVAVIVALVVVPAMLVVTQQRAASAATVLTILDGSASVARGTAAFVIASDGDIVNTGDRVQTADRSHAMVTFFDGSTLEIEPATTVQIEEAASAASGSISIRIAQAIGRTWASVQKLTHADSRFELRTPSLTAGVRGTGFITEVLADGTSTLETTDGLVQVTAQGQSVLVGAGQATTAAANAPPTAPAPPTRLPSRLRFGLHSPAYLVVVDPFGRACGIVLPGPTAVRQIPGCLASDPGTEPQLVDVANAPAGTYQLLVASIGPGAFIATASAVDGLGNLAFNYTASGTGEAGARYATSIDIEAGPNGVLSARGLAPLVAVEKTLVKGVRAFASPRPSASGLPDPSAFPPLPVIGFAAGGNITLTPPPVTSPAPLPVLATSPLPTLPGALTSALPSPPLGVPPVVLPSLVPSLAPTLVPTVVPLPLPTLIVITPPTLQPTPTPQPTPTAAPLPTPTVTPLPTPIPLPPTVSGGTALPGATLGVLGTNWPAGAAVTVTWPDGTQVATADVAADGRFATLVRVPLLALAGSTYRITASGGGRTATADVVILFSPSLTLVAVLPPRPGALVPYSGIGWPSGAGYVVLFDGAPVGSGGVVSAVGTLSGVFNVPQSTLSGAHTVTVTSGAYSASASLTTQ